MNNHQIKDYAQILGILEELSKDKKTGTLFITTDQKHAARFVMERGSITSIGYRQLHGYDALPKISEIRSGSYRFVEDGFITMEQVPLPSTDELLEMLNQGSQQNAGPSVTSGVLKNALDALEKEYAYFLGPIAGIICEEYIEDNGEPKDQNEFLKMAWELSEEIDNISKREIFNSKAKQLI